MPGPNSWKMFLEGVNENEGTQLPGASRYHHVVHTTCRLLQASLPFGQERLRAFSCLHYNVSFSPKHFTLKELKEAYCFDFPNVSLEKALRWLAARFTLSPPRAGD